MHDCGRDNHLSIGLRLANLVAENANKFAIIIRIIIHRTEEGGINFAAGHDNQLFDINEESLFVFKML